MSAQDLLRVQTPLTVLNDFPPFNRTNNKWEAATLPALPEPRPSLPPTSP